MARECLKGAARTVDFTDGRNLHGVLSLIAATQLAEQLPPREALLPMGQAITYLSGQPKRTGPPSWLVYNPDHDEVSLPAAIATYAAREDPEMVEEAVRAFIHQASHFGGNWGHALIFATMTYDAGKLLGWDVAAPLFAVGLEQVLPSGHDESAHEAVWGRFERGHFDFSAMSRQPPSRSGADQLPALRKALRKPSTEEAVSVVGRALETAVSPEILCEALVLAGADKMLRTAYNMAAVHALTFAHAVRRAVEVQRDGCTIGAIAVAAAFLGSQLEVYDRRAEGSRAGAPTGPAPPAAEFERLLRAGPVGAAVDAARAISSQGLTQKPEFFQAAVRAAASDDLILSMGLGLKHTQAALEEDRRTEAEDKASFLMSVAKNLSASERGTAVRDKLLAAVQGRPAV